MAITLATGEALTGDGNELAHIDLLIGSKSGPVGADVPTYEVQVDGDTVYARRPPPRSDRPA